MEFKQNCIFTILLCWIFYKTSAICPPNFRYVKTSCMILIKQPETWERAYNVCRHYSSYLLNFERISYSEIMKIVVNEVDAVHIGIRWKNGTLISQGASAKSYKRTVLGLRYGWEDAEPLNDCLSIRFSTGKLFSVSCDHDKLSYICVLEMDYKSSILCEENWKYSYLSGNCVKEFASKKYYSDAVNRCNYYKSRLISEENFNALVPVFTSSKRHLSMDTSVWVETTQNCTMKYVNDNNTDSTHTNCSIKNMYTCVKHTKKLDISAHVLPQNLPAISREKFESLKLSMDVMVNGQKYDPNKSTNIVWWKGVKPISYGNTSFVPAKNINSKHQSSEDRYFYSFTMPGYPFTIFSENIDIFLLDIQIYLLRITTDVLNLHGQQPYVLNLHGHERSNFSEFYEQVKPRINKLLKDMKSELPSPNDFTWNLMTASGSDANIILDIRLLFDYTNKTRPLDERNEIYEPMLKFLNKNIRKKLGNWSIINFEFKIIGQCFEEKDIVNNLTFIWRNSYHSKFIVSSPPCLTRDWELVTRTCDGGYMLGSKWEDFDYSKCVRHNEFEANPPSSQCMPGYTIWGYDVCTKLYKNEMDWFTAAKECGKARGYLFTLSIDPYIPIQDLDSSFNFEFTEMWLGGYRNMGLFQWIAFYPHTINTTRTTNIIWAKENPVLGNDCISGEITEGKLILFSRPCHEKRRFMCMHKEFHEDHQPNRCSTKWKSWPALKNCYRHTDTPKSWIDAQYYCKKQGGKLATLHNPDINVFVKSYIMNFYFGEPMEEAQWWIGLRRTENGFIWEDENEAIRYVDWDPTTNFQMNFSAGCLISKDFNITWYLNTPDRKNHAICQKKANPGRVWSRLEKVSARVFKCSSNLKYYNSVTWYKDGIVINGTRGLMDVDDRYLIPTNFLSSNALINRGRIQGYYWCEIYQEEPFIPVASPKILFLDENIWTFIGQFYSSMILNQLDPSSSGYWKKSRIIEKNIEAFLHPKIKTSIYVSHLSKIKQKIKIKFFIYIQLPEKKRSLFTEDNKKKLIDDVLNYIATNSSAVAELKILPGSMKIKNTDGCFSEKTKIGERYLTWPRKSFDQIALPEENCVTEKGEPVVRRCLGNFTEGAYWSDVNGTCTGDLTNLTLTLKNLAENDDVNITETVSRLTYDAVQLRPIDLHYVAAIMEKFASRMNHQYSPKEFSEIVSTVNNLMNINSSVSASANNRVNASSRITASLEKILDTNNGSINIVMPNILVNSWPLNSDNRSTVGIVVTSADDKIKHINEEINLSDDRYLVGFRLPSDLIQKRTTDNSSLNFIIYKNSSLFLLGLTDQAIVSSILYAQITGNPVHLDSKRIEIAFQTVTVEYHISGTERCVFWDYSLNNKDGGWSTEGCVLRNRTGNCLICSCDHMTNFAILMDINSDVVESEKHAIALDVFTYLGCTLSIIGLLLTLLTFLIFKKLRKGIVTKVLCSLTASLLLSLIVFIAGINQTSSKTGCIFAAALLHYLLMTSFCWMLVEAVQQYLRLVKVFDTYIPRFMLKASIFAWGSPLLITVIILAVDYKLYHGGKKYCWLQVEAIYYGFFLPVGLIMTINIIVFCLVIYSINCGRKGGKPNRSEIKLAIMQLRATICIFTLLGLSWTFGFLTIIKSAVVFKYLFTICTTLQGFVIFAFHILSDETARDLWCQYISGKVIHRLQTSDDATMTTILSRKISK